MVTPRTDPKIKTHILKSLEFRINMTAGDAVNFLNTVPPSAKLKFHEPKSYPGEQGIVPGYIEASWDE